MDVEKLIKQSRKDHRVDVIDLARRLGIDVYAIDLKDGNGCIRYKKDTDSFYIVVNSGHPVTRQRFTIAHEIGHYLKHKNRIKEKGQLDRDSDCKDDDVSFEQEADKQAAEILMPNDIVNDYLAQKEWSAKTRFNADMVSDIADHFRVSRTMAVTRLRELKIPIPYISFA